MEIISGKIYKVTIGSNEQNHQMFKKMNSFGWYKFNTHHSLNLKKDDVIYIFIHKILEVFGRLKVEFIYKDENCICHERDVDFIFANSNKIELLEDKF